MDVFDSLASIVCAKNGMDFGAAQRVQGWTNAVWISNEHVLRMAKTIGKGRLSREAELLRALPPTVECAQNVANGVINGYEWSIFLLVRGEQLGEAWAGMEAPRRLQVLRGIWEAADALHQVRLDEIESLTNQGAWYSAFDPEGDRRVTDQLIERGAIGQDQARAVAALLERFYPALEDAPRVLNHGDITLQNSVWTQEERATLLDFEHAVYAPIQLDIHSLLRIASGRDDEKAMASPPVLEGYAPLIQQACRLAAPHLQTRQQVDLLLGFAVLHAQRRMLIWLGDGEFDQVCAAWEPYRALQSLIDGEGGYLRFAIEQAR